MVDVDSLHNLEVKILQTLEDLGNSSTENILIKKTGLDQSKVHRAVEWLKEKKLLNIDEEIKQKFKITKKGEKCLKKGMPEKRFLKAIKNKEMTFEEIRKEADLDKNEFNAAIGYLKKEGFIKINNKKIKITKSGKNKLESKWKHDEILPVLKDWQFIDQIEIRLKELIPFLIDRNLVEEEEFQIRNISLTDKGRKILPKIEFNDEIELVTPEIILNESWKNKKFRKYNISAPSSDIHLGKKQAYLKFVDELKKKLISLGFEEMESDLVDMSFFNNDLLFMPQDHPARDIHDIYFLKNKKGNLKKYKKLVNKTKKVHENGWETGSKGWGYIFDKNNSKDVILRSHTTTTSIRKLISDDLKIPGKYFTIDRVYRPDVIDWKHLTEFDQIDGIILGDEMSFRELLGVLKMFALEVGNVEKFKFTPGYFPFTEPSVEIHVYVKGKGWVEIGGAGIFRPEVTLPLGIEVPVIAWGLGLLRLFMTKYDIKDMRKVFSDDLKWLRDFRW